MYPIELLRGCSSFVRVLKGKLTTVLGRLGYGNASDLPLTLNQIRNDPGFKFSNSNETVQFMKDTVAKILSRLHLIFHDDVIKMKGLADIDVVKGELKVFNALRPGPDPINKIRG